VGLTFFVDDLYFEGINLYNSFADEPLDVTDTRLSPIAQENKRLEALLTDNEHSLFNLVLIGDGMTMGGTRIRYQDAGNIYNTFMSFEQDDLFKNELDYVLNVILTQWFSGHTENTMTLLDQLNPESLTQEQTDQYHLIKAGISLTYYELDQVMVELKSVSDTYLTTKSIIQNFIVMAYGYDAEILQYSNSANLKFDAYYEHLSRYSGRDYINDIQSDLDDVVYGNVTINGEVFEGAIIYPSYHRGMSSYEGISDNSLVITGTSRFELKVNSSKLASVNILVPWQRVHDKQFVYDRTIDDFNYEFSDGVQFDYVYIEDDNLYYKILNGKEDTDYIMRVQFFEPNLVNDQSYYTFSGPEGVIPMDELHKHMRFLFNFVSSSDTLNIERFLEHFYVSGTYSLTVKEDVYTPDVYVSNGIMSESLEYLVEYDGVEMNEGDLLLAEGKVFEAIDWYDAHDSQHNLKVLYALYYWGMIAYEGEWAQLLEGQDTDQALYYLDKLIDLYGETTYRLSNKAMLLSKNDNYVEEEKVLKRILETDYNVYDAIDLAVNKINRGHYFKGLEALNEFDMTTLGDRYYEYYILGDILDTLPKKIKENLELIPDKSTYNVFFKYIKMGDYQLAYEWLLEQDDSELKTMYQLFFISKLSYKGFELPYEEIDDELMRGSDYSVYYKDAVDNMSKGPIKSFLMYFKESSGWY
jgi:hypothetical protein